jgi:energy-converting hydrogenase A subunit R
MAKVICFDLEGPLSPQDNAFEVMGLVENGHRLFEAISRYDDILTLEERPGYEPGDTLALIVPFLLYHKLEEQSVREVSSRAVLVDGARELVSGLKNSGWKVFIISTSYEQHAHNIGAQVGVDEENIHCTRFPLSKFLERLEGTDLSEVESVEQQLLELLPIEADEKDEQLKDILNRFYWENLEGTPLGEIITNLNVVGGERKVDAARKVAEANECGLGDMAVVGDSITDFKMLGEVHSAGGLAVAFNANIYAVPYATVSLASESLNDLRPLLDTWSEAGRDSALTEIESLMNSSHRNDKYHFHNLTTRTEYDDILAIHKTYRSLVRGKAAKLG